ncbi:hypothetical protein PV783_30180 [Chitinophaga sp. CC14]|uniref:hypothetical protein n=1 Tax=Chitinophaga sp. CC14 TaxID=3029199 RepID=UPI003B7EBDAE
MSIDNKIWYEFVHTKMGDEYLSLYLCRQRDVRKWFKIGTIVFSAGGVFGWAIWQPIAWFACAAIAVVQVFTSVESFLIHTEDQLDSLSKLRLLYYSRANNLEELWHQLVKEEVTEDAAGRTFFDLRRSAYEIEELDNQLNIKTIKRLKLKAQARTEKYIKTYHNI